MSYTPTFVTNAATEMEKLLEVRRALVALAEEYSPSGVQAIVSGLANDSDIIPGTTTTKSDMQDMVTLAQEFMAFMTTARVNTAIRVKINNQQAG